MSLESKTGRITEIMEGILAEHKPNVLALSLHDVEDQCEIAWAGKRTVLSEEIGVAVSERMRGRSVQMVCDGFKAIGRGHWVITHDAFTLTEITSGKSLDHIVVLLQAIGKPLSRYALSFVFLPGLSPGLRTVIEKQAVRALDVELKSEASGSIQLPR